MRATISIVIGLAIILICYQIIKRELNGAIIRANSKYGHINDENTKTIISNLDEVENTVNELNRSFYELVSELEGKYSVHDKEIELLNEKIEISNNRLEKSLAEISDDISEGKKNITQISKDQKNNEKIIRNKIIKNDVDQNASLMSQENEKNSNMENKKRRNTFSKENHIATLNANDKTDNHEIEKLNENGKKIFIESLDEIEKEKLREKIIDLRHRGFSINQIAKKLGVGVGELQLVLNLHRK